MVGRRDGMWTTVKDHSIYIYKCSFVSGATTVTFKKMNITIFKLCYQMKMPFFLPSDVVLVYFSLCCRFFLSNIYFSFFSCAFSFYDFNLIYMILEIFFVKLCDCMFVVGVVRLEHRVDVSRQYSSS